MNRRFSPARVLLALFWVYFFVDLVLFYFASPSGPSGVLSTMVSIPRLFIALPFISPEILNLQIAWFTTPWFSLIFLIPLTIVYFKSNRKL